jgi:transcriptional antiterminator NusG
VTDDLNMVNGPSAEQLPPEAGAPPAEAPVEAAPVAEMPPIEAPVAEPPPMETGLPAAAAEAAPVAAEPVVEAAPVAEAAAVAAPAAEMPVGQAFLPAGERADGQTGMSVPPDEAKSPPAEPPLVETGLPAAAAEAAPEVAEAAPVVEAVPVVQSKAVAASAEPAAPPPEPVEEPKSDKMDWYILKVQSNREESIREGLLRRVNIAGLQKYFGDVIVPTEKVTEFKGGKKRVIKRKLYPGYLVVHMEINDDTWFLVRETPGIGDFTGAAGHPSPMLPHEVARIVSKAEEKSEKAPKLKIAFRVGDRVKINEGTFENFEGEVDSIDETNGRVTVMINIFGRSTPVELEYWQIEAL